jgi:hypothetical protein
MKKRLLEIAALLACGAVNGFTLVSPDVRAAEALDGASWI